MENITNHIEADKKELDNPAISPQRRRHISQELESLELYREKHPNDDKDPSPLELFCSENPDALECRIYE
jgi:hypothetical protein